MKRQGACLECVAKRQCLQQLADAQDNDGCSSASPTAFPVQQKLVMMQPLLPQQGVKQQLAPALVEHVLERTLFDADAALRLTLHAMSLATQIYECGAPDAADRTLNIAEQALAATVQQLARAQALVAHKAQAQHMGLHAAAFREEEDADLQDTCSSSFSACTSAGFGPQC